MRILLTGATGFIGQHVLKTLIQQNIAVVVIGRTQPTDHTVAFIEADLLSPHTDMNEIVQQAQATHLLHLAWYAEHGKYWHSPLNLRWVEASIKLVEAFCGHGGERVVMAGTCAEYDWRYGYCQEDITPINPTTLYGTAKDATRRLAQAICEQHHVDFVWGRIFFAYGKGEPESRLIPSLERVFLGKEKPFTINGDTYRDFLHVSDVAEAFSLLLHQNALGVYNISSGIPIKISELIRLIAENHNADPNIMLKMIAHTPCKSTLLVGDKTKLDLLHKTHIEKQISTFTNRELIL